MNIDQAVEQILGRYMTRVQVKPGNGLSKCMNQNLRSYEQIPVIITRTVALLAGTESLFGFSGVVRMDTQDLYNTLMDMHDDWVEEVPRLGQLSEHQIFASRLMEGIETGEVPPLSGEKGTVAFRRVPKLPLHQFSAAWSIARRLGVIAGRGELGLGQTVLAELKRLQSQASSQAPQQPAS